MSSPCPDATALCIAAHAAGFFGLQLWVDECVRADVHPASLGTMHAIVSGRKPATVDHWRVVASFLSPAEVLEASAIVSAQRAPATVASVGPLLSHYRAAMDALGALADEIDAAETDGEYTAAEVAECRAACAQMHEAVSHLEARIGRPRVVGGGVR